MTVSILKVSDVFLQDILQSWSVITFENDVTSVAQLRSQSLWFKSLIRVENKPIYYKSWASRGILFIIRDLMANESTFLSFLEFKDRYSIKPSFLSFLGIISAIKQLFKTLKEKNSSGDSAYENFYDKFLKAKNPNKTVYKKVVDKKRRQPLNSQMKWSVDCSTEQNEPVNWAAVYRKPFQCTKICKLLVFQSQ